jgi:hypothetical protein
MSNDWDRQGAATGESGRSPRAPSVDTHEGRPREMLLLWSQVFEDERQVSELAEAKKKKFEANLTGPPVKPSQSFRRILPM